MKHLLATALASLSLAAFGAWEKVASARLADAEALMQGVTRAGELTGNQMLGMMAAQMVGQLPGADLMGPGRPGAAISYVLFVDGKALSKDPSEMLGALKYAVLYPVAQTKDAFLKDQEGAVETNGVVRVCASDGDDEEDKKVTFVAFSTDGKWAAYGDDAQCVKAALADVKDAERKMKGDLVALQVAPHGLTLVQRVIDEAIKEAAKDEKLKDKVSPKHLANVREVLASVTACYLGVRVGERGIEVRSATGVKKDSYLTRVGQKAISANSWKGADPAAIVFAAGAEDTGTEVISGDVVLSVLKKHGIDLPFLTIAKPMPNYEVVTVDVTGASACQKTLTNAVEKVDAKQLEKDLMALMPSRDSLLEKNPEFGFALVVKDFKPVADPKTRFEKTLPEVKDKPVIARGFISVYSLLKSLVPVFLANVDANTRASLEPVLKNLPPEGVCGTAYASWREKNTWRTLLRVSADELKGLSGCFAAFMAMSMQQSLNASEDDE